MSSKPHTATIFVQIPSYRDADCTRTVADLFQKATSPERVSVGICWQYFQDKEQPLHFKGHPHEGRIRIMNVDAAESKGIAWAKCQAQTLWQNEAYVLQVDSHTRFVKGWDEAMLAELAACKDEKAVLSAPPPGFTLPDNVRADTKLSFRAPQNFDPSGLLRLKTDFFTRPLEKPLQHAFVAPRFMFSRAGLLQEVPADPAIYVEEEEATLSARLWTHGWQVYSPRKHLLFHLYNNDGKQRPLHWKDHKNWSEFKTLSQQRYRYLMGIETPKPHEPTHIPAPYSLGTAHSLAEFQAFCGVDFRAQGPVANANHCVFFETIKPYTTALNYWLQPNFAPAPAANGNTASVAAVVTQKKVAPASPLGVGDYVPYFDLPDQDGNLRELQLYAGKPGVLFFLPPNHTAFTKDFFASLNTHYKEFQEQGLQRIIIVPADVATVKQWQDTFEMNFTLWADEGGNVAKLFGLEPPYQPTSFLLSPNLKIMAVYEGLEAGKHIQGSLEDCETHFPEEEPVVVSSHAPILVVPNALSEEMCQEIIRYWENNEQYEGTVGVGKDRQVKPNIKRRVDVDIRDKAFLERLDNELSKTMLPEIRKISSIEMTHRELYKIGCYSGEVEGHYSRHRDTSTLSLANRRYSVSICLNDDYEGGGLNFPEYGTEIYRAAPGTALVFPSTLMHRVLPVTEGRRFVMVSFMFGEEEAAFRSQYKRSRGEKDDTEEDRFLRTLDTSGIKESRVYTQRVASVQKLQALTRGSLSSDGQRADFASIVAARELKVHQDVPPGVLVIDNYLSKTECSILTAYADRMAGRKLEVVDNEKSTHGKTVTKASESRITEYVSIDGIAPQALPLFTDIYGTVLSSFYQVDFEWFERPQMLRYPPGGRYNQHADAEHLDKETNTWVRAQDRDYSILVYLNEEYEGGELELINYNFRIKPTTGMLLAFPSDHRYLHAALPTTSGIRYALVSWAAALGTRRVKERAPYAATFLKLKA